MKTIAVIVAMSSEMRQVEGLLHDCCKVEAGPFSCLTGHMGGKEIVLMQCGIGKVNAAVGATEMIKRFKPDVIVSTGVAGGLDQSLRVMDVVVGRSVCYHDLWCGPGTERGEVQGLAKAFEGDRQMLRTAVSMPTDTRIHPGLIVTGDRFITSREELEEIKGAFPEALAVDMESGAIAHAATLYGVPFISFRIISDTPGAEGHQQQYEGFWDRMADSSFGVTRLFLEQLDES